MDRNRAWVRYSTLQSLPVCAIKFGNVQVLCVTIQPIQFPTNPIDSNTLETQTVVTDDWFSLAAVHWCSK